MTSWDIVEGLIDKDPFINLLGIKTRIIDEGRAEAILDLKEQHMRAGNIMNGGAIASLIDTAGGAAVLSKTMSNQVTLNLNLNFLKAISQSPVKAVGNVVKGGKNVFFVTVEVFDGDGKLCANATGSWFILRN